MSEPASSAASEAAPVSRLAPPRPYNRYALAALQARLERRAPAADSAPIETRQAPAPASAGARGARRPAGKAGRARASAKTPPVWNALVAAGIIVCLILLAVRFLATPAAPPAHPPPAASP